MFKTHVTNVKNTLKAKQTKILTTALVATTTIAVLQNRGIAGLNAFLIENDLFDAYYNSDNED